MEQRKPSKKTPVDREKICPFIVRLFWKENEFHTIESFKDPNNEPVSDELQIYTWKDTTLREIVDLVKTVLPVALKREARFRFSFLIQDLNGDLKRKEVGTIHSVKKSKEDYFTLQELRFVIGDFIDLNIQTA